MNGQKVIACLGGGSGSPGEVMYDTMREVGVLLARGGAVVATGGYGGAGMEAPIRGAKESGGKTLVYLFHNVPPNSYVENTGDGEQVTRICDCGAQAHFYAPIPPIREIQYGIRLGGLLTADAFIIAAWGGPGTMTELMAIINLNSKQWRRENRQKRCAILKPPMEPFTQNESAWNEAMLQSFKTMGLFPESVAPFFACVDTPRRAVQWVLS